MADAPSKAILEALAAALRTITVANGYRTDLGLNVRTERSETGLPAAPRCTVAVTGKVKAPNGQQRPSKGRGIRGVIEAHGLTSVPWIASICSIRLLSRSIAARRFAATS